MHLRQRPHIPGRGQKHGRQKMAQAKQFLGRDPSIRHNAYYGRHKQRNKALRGEKQTNIFRQTHIGQKGTHGSQISPPHCILEEVHHGKTGFNVHKDFPPAGPNAWAAAADITSGRIRTANMAILLLYCTKKYIIYKPKKAFTQGDRFYGRLQL